MAGPQLGEVGRLQTPARISRFVLTLISDAGKCISQFEKKPHTKHSNHLPIKMMAPGPEGKRLVKATSQTGRAGAGGPCGTESQGFTVCCLEPVCEEGHEVARREQPD